MAILLTMLAPAPPRLVPDPPPDAAIDPANALASMVALLRADCERTPVALMLELLTYERISAGALVPSSFQPMRF